MRLACKKGWYSTMICKRTVAEYSDRLVEMLCYFDSNDISYKFEINKGGTKVLTVEYATEKQKEKADMFETELIIKDKTDSKVEYNNIKDLRLAAKLTQQGFGDLLGIPLRTVQDWEADFRICKKYVFKLIEYRLKNGGYIK